MNIIELDKEIEYIYEELYKDNSWQCRRSLVEDLFIALEDINEKGYERSLCSKFKVAKFKNIYSISFQKSDALYLPFYTSLVKH